MNDRFWRGKRVLVTGHTGFKGSWLSVWLQRLGARVAGYALLPEVRSLHELALVREGMESTYGDIRDLEALRDTFHRFSPEIVFHLAAQPLVRLSYAEPVATYQTNIMGTAHLLEAARSSESCRVVVCVTSDKCYENREWPWGYRENDVLGGRDPYSSSKACAELVISAYRQSFFEAPAARVVGVASARAGNVIGGGDFSRDRLVPDVMTALLNGTSLRIRFPDATRPWQHVLEPLAGYLQLAEKLWDEPRRHAQGWNFGPAPDDTRPVSWIVQRLGELWGEPVRWETDDAPRVHEAGILTLDSARARAALGWKPRWTLDRALRSIVTWYQAYDSRESLRDVVIQDIASYEAMADHPDVPR